MVVVGSARACAGIGLTAEPAATFCQAPLKIPPSVFAKWWMSKTVRRASHSGASGAGQSSRLQVGEDGSEGPQRGHHRGLKSVTTSWACREVDDGRGRGFSGRVFEVAGDRSTLDRDCAKHGGSETGHGLAVDLADAGFGDAKDLADFLEGHVFLVVKGNDKLFAFGQVFYGVGDDAP